MGVSSWPVTAMAGGFSRSVTQKYKAGDCAWYRRVLICEGGTSACPGRLRNPHLHLWQHLPRSNMLIAHLCQEDTLYPVFPKAKSRARKVGFLMWLREVTLYLYSCGMKVKSYSVLILLCWHRFLTINLEKVFLCQTASKCRISAKHGYLSKYYALRIIEIKWWNFIV